MPAACSRAEVIVTPEPQSVGLSALSQNAKGADVVSARHDFPARFAALFTLLANQAI